MPIIYQKFISRAEVQANPKNIYVFGDNLMSVGYGGQAREMRGELNAVGIPTKFSPSAYLSDERDFMTLVLVYHNRFAILQDHLDADKTIVWPTDGIGTGLADMERRAPHCWQLLQTFIEYLKIVDKAIANG